MERMTGLDSRRELRALVGRGHNSPPDCCSVPRHLRARQNAEKNGADDGARTRYLHLGKVALYQMSYIRKWCFRSESNQRHADFQSAALPTELQKHKWRPGTGSNRRPLA